MKKTKCNNCGTCSCKWDKWQKEMHKNNMERRTEKKKLNPCLYCGGERFISLYKVTVPEHELFGMWRIGCGSCGIRTFKKTKEDALNFWNKKVMPTELTAENGAKYLLMGEFFEHIEVENPDFCGCGDCDYCHEFDPPETIIQHIQISWSTIKDIYKKTARHYV